MADSYPRALLTNLQAWAASRFGLSSRLSCPRNAVQEISQGGRGGGEVVEGVVGRTMGEAESTRANGEYPPRALRVTGWLAVPGTLFFALDVLYSRTVRTWQAGPDQIIYTLALGHALPFVSLPILLSVLGAHIVILATLFLPLLGGRNRPRTGKFMPLAPALLLCSLCAVYIPEAVWQIGIVRIQGPGVQGGSFLAAAARKGEQWAVRGLLAQGVAVDADDDHGRTALNVACYAKNIPMAKYLISRGADVKRAPECDWLEEIVSHPDRVRGPDTRIVVH
jgi:Ankyrin repeats (3 copies)